MKINITETAKKEIEKITDSNERTAKIAIAGSRCMVGTVNLTLEFVKLKEEDNVILVDDIKITYNKEIEDFVDKVEIDYQEEGMKRGFNVDVVD